MGALRRADGVPKPEHPQLKDDVKPPVWKVKPHQLKPPVRVPKLQRRRQLKKDDRQLHRDHKLNLKVDKAVQKSVAKSAGTQPVPVVPPHQL